MKPETKHQCHGGQAPGRLFVVATPIGNLGDITYRAVETLKAVDAIAAEDTRNSCKLLQHYGIDTPMFSLHEHNEKAMIERLLTRLEAGEDIALISDAGTPLISDPGYRLVQALRQRGLGVIPVPGPSSIIAALSAAGLPTDEFHYFGFLARSGSARRMQLERIAANPATSIMLESPRRLLKSLKDIGALLEPERIVCVARELTKLHEEFVQGSIGEVIEYFSNHNPRGEIVLLVGGGNPMSVEVDDAQILEALESEAMQQLSPSARASRIARQLGVPKSRVYDLAVGRGPDS